MSDFKAEAERIKSEADRIRAENPCIGSHYPHLTDIEVIRWEKAQDFMANRS
jgi:hypothetical protein